VIPEPEVFNYKLEDNDRFLVICSDGIWEFMSDWEVGSIIDSNSQNLNKAAERLATIAWTRWIKQCSNIVDDITIIIASLPDFRETL
jgi:serine/threonine protein phosphatase PrpC